ncbi:MAG: DUF805 domain-containing protein [Caulobacterales bacterium]|nr:DUF805 domain-containing protein [Caulobacterales bacterium]
MDKLGGAFSFQGRLNRAPYWQGTILAWMAVVVLGFIASGLGTLFAPLGLLAIVPLLAGMVVVLSLLVRRLHDRGKSGWWLLLMYLPPLLLSALGAVVSASEPDVGSTIRALSLPFSIWMFVDLGCLRGTMGHNRFGPDPLQGEMVEVFS